MKRRLSRVQSDVSRLQPRRKKRQSPEDTLYREIEATMSLPFDFDRLRTAAGLDSAAEPAQQASTPAVPPTPRRRFVPTLAAVAATLALVSVTALSGLWIADRLRSPAHGLPPVSETGDTEPDSLPETPSETPTDTPPELQPPESLPPVPADAPETLVIGNVTYTKTKTGLSEDMVGEPLEPIGEQREPGAHVSELLHVDPSEAVAVYWHGSYICYVPLESSTDTAPS